MNDAFQNRRRVSIDAMRGLIMVLMALDHASFFIAKTHSSEFWGAALPTYDRALPFIVRAVTHLCAPGFFLLMGIGMILFVEARARDGWRQWRISRFFLVRGILLIVIQQVLENPAWLLGSLGTAPGAFTFRGGPVPGGGDPAEFYLGVLFGLGSTMAVWGILIGLPSLAIISISLAAIVSTQVIIVLADPRALYPPIVRMLILAGHTNDWMVFFPTIPWMGVTGLGIVLGRWISEQRTGVFCGLWLAGVAALAVFAAVRLLFGHGSHLWANSGWIDFFNVTKYPPGAAFLFLTLGMNLLLLHLSMRLENSARPLWKPLVVFGASPLFFYIAHLYLYALMGWAFPRGVRLEQMIPVWLAGLLVLYPFCLGYGRFKKNRPPGSLWRLF
ncbi:MAG: DUF1624 domain-containing protein [Desulfobacterales bacterium]